MKENNTTAVAAENATQKKQKGNFITRKLSKIAIAINTAIMMGMFSAVNAFADEPAVTTSGTSGGINGNEGVTNFNAIIQFFAEWIGRIGLVVGFVGAIMFALAIKNDDAEAKTRGLMTLASGFVVFAITKALDMFGITSTTTAVMLF